MDERSLLTVRVDTALLEINRAAAALDSPGVDEKLRQRVRVRFEEAFQEQRRALTDVRKKVMQGDPPDECWDDLRAIRGEGRSLIGECLALVEGALARAARIDDGLCAIADALLGELDEQTDNRWKRFTVLSEDEFIGDMAAVIRVRFPEVSLWSLPIAAHEFGHFIGPELIDRPFGKPTRHPFEDILEREREQDDRRWHVVHEHFADLFATLSLGPAFACSAILTRFDPRTASIEGALHPSAAERVYWITKALQLLDDAEGGIVRPYRDVMETLSALWTRSLEPLGSPPELDAPKRAALDRLFDELAELADRKLSSVRYRGWLRAQTLAVGLPPDRDGEPRLKEGDRIADVLNAAWLVRLRQWSSDGLYVSRLGEKALAACRKLVH